MNIGPLAQNCKIVLLDNPLTSGSTTNSRASKVVDMTGFGSVCVISTLGASTNATTITAQTASSTSDADFATVTHNATNITANSTASNGCIVLDVQNIHQRYFRVTCNTTGANVYGGTVAILYGALAMPTSNSSSDVLASYIGVST